MPELKYTPSRKATAMTDDIDPAVYKEICGIAEQIHELNKLVVAQLTPQVDYIIRNRITNGNQIEHLLDSLLDCAGMCDEGLLLFKRLCRYYFKIDPTATAEYILIYRDLYDSDEDNENSQ